MVASSQWSASSSWRSATMMDQEVGSVDDGVEGSNVNDEGDRMEAYLCEMVLGLYSIKDGLGVKR